MGEATDSTQVDTLVRLLANNATSNLVVHSSIQRIVELDGTDPFTHHERKTIFRMAKYNAIATS